MMTPSPALEGTVALVTGAAQGIGLSIAAGLRAQGARVALIDIHEEQLANATASLGGERQGSPRAGSRPDGFILQAFSTNREDVDHGEQDN